MNRYATWNSCPKSMVKLTSLYFMPRDSGGLCHQFSVPSVAYSAGWLLSGMLGSQKSQTCPWITWYWNWFCCSFSVLAPTSLQYSSGPSVSTPQVADAVILRPSARLKYGGVSSDWTDAIVADSKSAAAARRTPLPPIVRSREGAIDGGFWG